MQIGTHANFALFAAATFIFSFSASPVFTLTNDVILASAPPERAGAASGISETCAEFGGALSIAVFGSIGVAIYRAGVSDAMPGGLSQDAVKTAMATLGGAVATAKELPGRTGRQPPSRSRRGSWRDLDTLSRRRNASVERSWSASSALRLR